MQTLTQGALRVEAPVSGGTVVAAPSDPQLPVSGPSFHALEQPMHLEVEDGRLTGPATVSFNYDPAAIPDASQLFIATWLPQFGVWAPVDAQLDPGKHQIRTSTPHFSDWMIGVNDLDRSLYDKELRETFSGKIAAALVGALPELTCPADGPRLTASVKDVQPAVTVCLYPTPSGGQLQVGNIHGYPVRFELPSNVKNVSEPADDIFASLLQQSPAIPPGQVAVAPGDVVKLNLSSQDFFTVRPTITGHVDWTALTWDLIIAVAKLVLGTEFDRADTKALAKALSDSIDGSECAKSIYDLGEKPAVATVKELGEKLLTTCLGTVLAGLDKIFEIALAGTKFSADTIFKRLNVLKTGLELPKIAREELFGMLAVYGKAGGVVSGTPDLLDISVRPDNPGYSPTQNTNWQQIIDKSLCDYPDGAPRADIGQTYFSDITGDGFQDALVAVSCASPTSQFDELQLFDGARVGTLRQSPIGEIFHGDTRGTRVQNVTFAGRSLTISATGSSPSGSNAEPDLAIVESYTWKPGAGNEPGRLVRTQVGGSPAGTNPISCPSDHPTQLLRKSTSTSTVSICAQGNDLQYVGSSSAGNIVLAARQVANGTYEAVNVDQGITYIYRVAPNGLAILRDGQIISSKPWV